MRRVSRIVLAFTSGLAVLVSGCAPAGGGPPDGGLTIDNPYDGLWQDRAEVPIRFELEQTFGAEEEPVEAALSNVRYATSDHEGNVYVLDGGNSVRLLSFAPDGALRWEMSANGQGPGELQYPGRMRWNGIDRLYVVNQNGTRLEEFGAEGSLLGSQPIQLDSLMFPTLIGALSGDRLVFSGAMPGKYGAAVAIARLGNPWQVVARLEEDQVRDIPDVGTLGLGAAAPAFVHGDRIVVSHLAEYRIAIYDTTATLVRVIRRDKRDFVRPGFYQLANGGASLMPLGGLWPILPLSDDRMLAFAVWPTNERDPDEYVRRRMQGEPVDPRFRHSIDLFDSDGRLLYSLEGDGQTPDIGRPESADASGRLYTISSDPYPHVRRYRVLIDP